MRSCEHGRVGGLDVPVSIAMLARHARWAARSLPYRPLRSSTTSSVRVCVCVCVCVCESEGRWCDTWHNAWRNHHHQVPKVFDRSVKTAQKTRAALDAGTSRQCDYLRGAASHEKKGRSVHVVVVGLSLMCWRRGEQTRSPRRLPTAFSMCGAALVVRSTWVPARGIWRAI
jgi:hypothetical protein